MPHISQKRVKKDIFKRMSNEFVGAVAGLKGPSEIKGFLNEILTPTELENIKDKVKYGGVDYQDSEKHQDCVPREKVEEDYIKHLLEHKCSGEHIIGWLNLKIKAEVKDMQRWD